MSSKPYSLSRSTMKKPRYRVVWPVEAPISGPRMSIGQERAAALDHQQVPLPLDLEEPDRDPDGVLMRADVVRFMAFCSISRAEVGVLAVVDPRDAADTSTDAKVGVR